MCVELRDLLTKTLYVLHYVKPTYLMTATRQYQCIKSFHDSSHKISLLIVQTYSLIL